MPTPLPQLHAEIARLRADETFCREVSEEYLLRARRFRARRAVLEAELAARSALATDRREVTRLAGGRVTVTGEQAA